jgi:Restriction endonuclease
MAVTLRQSQAIAQIAEILHTFLPGKPHPYADQSLSFPGIAARLGLAGFWSGGSKKSATIRLLESTLDQHRGQFCRLITEVVRSGLRYRSTKTPISREEIEQLNREIVAVGFKIPELWDPKFLDNFPRTTAPAERPKEPKTPTAEDLRPLRPAFDALHALDAKARGFAFERFLRALFDASGLRGRSSFRLVGEQIDGSFSMGEATYVIEAKWENKPLDISPLFAFRSQVAKADWSRGLFISYSGFSDDACAALSRTGKLNSIGMTGQDLHFILEGKMGLIDAIRAKLTRAAEGDGFLVSVQELMLKL